MKAKTSPNAKSVGKEMVSKSAFQKLKENYVKETSQLVKFLDVYLLFCMATGILQFVYFCIVGSYQYNAFLGGFISSVGSFVLTGMSIIID